MKINLIIKKQNIYLKRLKIFAKNFLKIELTLKKDILINKGKKLYLDGKGNKIMVKKDFL